jgi:peptidoglycan L-alanyl-D-glutamate endopeptidase CwlK
MWASMSSRSLSDLVIQFRGRFVSWLAACKAAGADPLVTCTFRSGVEQDALYAIGRTEPGRIVTNARAGQSAHNYGLALDFVPLVAGKPMWSAKHPHWQLCGQLTPKFNLEWAGTWTRPKREYPHVQVPNWREVFDDIPRAA